MPSKSKSKHRLETRILAFCTDSWPEMNSVEYELRIVDKDGAVCFSDVVCCDLAHVIGLLLGVQENHPMPFPIHVNEVVPVLQLAESLLSIDHELFFQKQEFKGWEQSLVHFFAFSYEEPITFKQFELDCQDVVEELSSLVRTMVTDKNLPLLVKPERPEPPESAQPIILEPHFLEIKVSEPSPTEDGLVQFNFTFTGEGESFALLLTLPPHIWIGARISIAYALTNRRDQHHHLLVNDAFYYAFQHPVAFFQSEGKFVTFGPVVRRKQEANVHLTVYTVDGDQATLDYYRVPILALNRALATIERKLLGPVEL